MTYRDTSHFFAQYQFDVRANVLSLSDRISMSFCPSSYILLLMHIHSDVLR
jgi:hypothetical protein